MAPSSPPVSPLPPCSFRARVRSQHPRRSQTQSPPKSPDRHQPLPRPAYGTHIVQFPRTAGACAPRPRPRLPPPSSAPPHSSSRFPFTNDRVSQSLASTAAFSARPVNTPRRRQSRCRSQPPSLRRRKVELAGAELTEGLTTRTVSAAAASSWPPPPRPHRAPLRPSTLRRPLLPDAPHDQVQ